MVVIPALNPCGVIVILNCGANVVLVHADVVDTEVELPGDFPGFELDVVAVEVVRGVDRAQVRRR